MEPTAASTGQLRQKLVVRRLARHLGVVLVDDKAGPGGRKVLQWLAIDIFSGALRHDNVFARRLGLPEGAAFVALLARGRHLGVNIVWTDDRNVKAGVFLRNVDTAFAAQFNGEAEFAAGRQSTRIGDDQDVAVRLVALGQPEDDLLPEASMIANPFRCIPPAPGCIPA